MTRYQLAKLIALAGGELKSRKRLQKLVYLLQAAGCPLEASFRLHHYGPYSQEVAGLVDELVQVGVLAEMRADEGRLAEFSYQLTEAGHRHLEQFEASDRGHGPAAMMSAWEPRLTALVSENTRLLELASTIAYFRREMNQDLEEARLSMARFKEVPAEGRDALEALELARAIEG